MRCFKIKINKKKVYLLKDSEIEAILDDLRKMNDEDKIIITTENMTKEEYDKLPELEN